MHADDTGSNDGVRQSFESPQGSPCAQDAQEQLSRRASRAAEHLQARMAASHRNSPGKESHATDQLASRVPGSLRKGNASQQVPTLLPNRFKAESESPSPSTSPDVGHWASNMFGFWGGAGSQNSSPTATTEWTQSPDPIQQRRMSFDEYPSPDSGPPDRGLGRRSHSSAPDLTSALGSSMHRDDSYHHSVEEEEDSRFAESSADLAAESRPRLGGEAHLPAQVSVNTAPQDKLKSDHALLQGLQALGSAVNSAIDSFSVVRTSVTSMSVVTFLHQLMYLYALFVHFV